MIEHVKKAIENAENGISKLSKEALEIPGFTSLKIKHFLNNLCSGDDVKYIEVGLWMGATFIAANYNNNLKHSVGIDNFSDFTESEIYPTVKPSLYKNLETFKNEMPKVNILETDFRLTDLSEYDKFNIYFYDGNHNEKEQEEAFVLMDKYLADEFICIVDDWNWEEPKIGTKKAFEKLNYKILYEVEFTTKTGGDGEGWWNGFYIAVIKKDILYNHIHIPKCAGTTISEYCQKLNSDNYISTITRVMDEIKQTINETTLVKVISSHTPFGLHECYNDRRVEYTALFREPFQRILSEFYHAKTKGLILPDISIEEYITTPNLQDTRIDNYLENRQCKSILGSWDEDINKDNFKKVLENLKRIKYIGIVEEFDKFFQLLINENILPTDSYELANKSNDIYRIQEIPELIRLEINRMNCYDNILYEYVKMRLQ